MLRLRLFGTLELVGADGRERSALLAQPKRVALLAYLAAATPRGFYRRDTLIALLWPERDQAHARLALRQALHGLRAALGDGVVVSRGDEEVGLDAQALWCDAVAFDQAVANGRLEEALDLYRGELLEGFFISGATEFERWLERERARRREAAVASARTLVERAEATGELAVAIDLGRRSVRLAPLDEAAVTRLIALLDRVGDRAGAARTYEEFASRLTQELEVEPSPETKALIERVRAREAPGVAEPSPRSTKPPALKQEATPGGSTWVRPSRTRRRLLTPLAGVALLAATLVAVRMGRRVRAAASLDPKRVVVATFANRTGDSSLNPLGALAADWITDRLVRTGVVEVADPGPDPGGPAAARRTEATTDARALAMGTASGTTVWGAVYRRGDSVEFEARITDEVHGTLLRSLEPAVGSARDPRAAVAMLSQRVTVALATVMNPKLSEWANLASQPPTYEAYRAFAAGADAWFDRDDAREALPYFYRAARLDSTYTLPLVWAAWAHRSSGECDKTDSIGGVLGARPERLAPVDELYLERELAFCRGDYAAGYQLSRRLVAALPGSEAAQDALARDALSIGHPREALEILERLHPDRGALRGHPPYYLFLTTAHHLLGEHDQELAAARQGRRQFPSHLGALRWELLALAALGRVQEVREGLDEIPTLPRHARRTPGYVMLETALELRAHGHPGAGREVLQRALAWTDSRPSAERAIEASLGERLWILYAAERWNEARTLADRLVAEHPDNPTYLGLQGTLAAQRGERDQAGLADRVLASRWTRPPLRGEAASWRACIAAQLGRPTETVMRLRGAAESGWGFGANGILWLMALHVNPCFDSLRGLSDFQALLRPKG